MCTVHLTQEEYECSTVFFIMVNRLRSVYSMFGISVIALKSGITRTDFKMLFQSVCIHLFLFVKGEMIQRTSMDIYNSIYMHYNGSALYICIAIDNESMIVTKSFLKQNTHIFTHIIIFNLF